MESAHVLEQTNMQKIHSKCVAGIAIAISLFHLLNVSGVVTMSTMPIRIIHLLAMMMIVYLTKGAKREGLRKADYALRAVCFALTVFCSIYLLYRYEDISNSGGQTVGMDIVVGLIMMVVVLEATRRSVGLVLAIISTIFLVYPFVGPFLPGLLRTRNYSLTRIITLLFTTSDGIYGTPISVSANYIILFCIYGAFLSQFGAGEFLFKISASFTKRFTAAAAKTSIIFSALLGMLSGSAAGVVAVTGSLTIPMMQKEDYTKEESGAISAVAATGGQIMPPVMGAAAFIMASIIGVPYLEIMKASALPAVLYFFSIFVVVHLLAKKKNAKASTQYDDISFWKTFKADWPLAIPIIALIVLMIIGYSPFKAAFWSIISLVLVYVPHRWIQDKSFDVKDFFHKVVVSLEQGAKDTVSIAVACAAAGIISGILSVTGLSTKLASLIVVAAHGQLFIALFLTMIISLILGMGLPTTAAYLVLATVIAPALVQMGASLLSAHLFVFYFGCISTITPPVALASYVAAGIAKADLNKVGYKAFWYGIVSFILPYMFVYGPSLLLEGSVLSIIQTVIFSIIGTTAIGMAVVGYIKTEINIPLRLLLVVSGILMIFEGLVSDVLGIGIFISIVLFSYVKYKNHSKETIVHG